MRYALILIACFSTSAAAGQPPNSRDESLINAFQIMCFLEPILVYDRIDAKAAAMRMATIRVQPPIEVNGISMKGHIWGGKLTTGPFILHLYQQRRTGEAASSCGVSGPVDEADKFRDDLVRIMQLPPLPPPSTGTDGSRAYIWNNYLEQNHRLILRSTTGADGRTSVMVTLSEKERM